MRVWVPRNSSAINDIVCTTVNRVNNYRGVDNISFDNASPAEKMPLINVHL